MSAGSWHVSLTKWAKKFRNLAGETSATHSTIYFLTDSRWTTFGTWTFGVKTVIISTTTRIIKRHAFVIVLRERPASMCFSTVTRFFWQITACYFRVMLGQERGQTGKMRNKMVSVTQNNFRQITVLIRTRCGKTEHTNIGVSVSASKYSIYFFPQSCNSSQNWVLQSHEMMKFSQMNFDDINPELFLKLKTISKP